MIIVDQKIYYDQMTQYKVVSLDKIKWSFVVNFFKKNENQ